MLNSNLLRKFRSLPPPRTRLGPVIPEWDWEHGNGKYCRLTNLMYESAVDLPSFPRLFIDEQEYGPVTAGPPIHTTNGQQRFLHPRAYAAALEPGPAGDSGINEHVILIMFITRFRHERLGYNLNRQYHNLHRLLTGPALVDPFVLAIGSRVPPADSVQYDVMPNGTPVHAPVKHIGQLRSTAFSEADQERAIGKIMAIAMADGQTEAAVNRAAHAVFEESDLDEHPELPWRLFILGEEHPEYRQWIENAVERVDPNAPSAMQKILRREPTLINFLRNSSFRNAFEARVRKLQQEEEWEDRWEEGFELGRREGHVAALLGTLRARGIELHPSQEATLRELKFTALPEMGVATAAQDADDFVRLAELPSNR